MSIHLSNAKLPDEMLIKVFSHLDARSLGSSTGVCRAWFRVGSDDELWRAMFPRLETAVGEAKATLSMLAVGSEASLLNRVSAFATGVRYGEKNGFVCLYPHNKSFMVIYIHQGLETPPYEPVNLGLMRAALFPDPMELALFQSSMSMRGPMLERSALIEGTRHFDLNHRGSALLTIGVGSFVQDVESNGLSIDLHGKIVNTIDEWVKDDESIALDLISLTMIYGLALAIIIKDGL